MDKEFQVVRFGKDGTSVVVACEETYIAAANRRRELRDADKIGFRYRVRSIAKATTPNT